MRVITNIGLYILPFSFPLQVPASSVREILVDTNHFKGNFPESCVIEACYEPELAKNVDVAAATFKVGRKGGHRGEEGGGDIFTVICPVSSVSSCVCRVCYV